MLNLILSIMKKSFLFLCMFFLLVTFARSQVIFDPASVAGITLPTGSSIVVIDGTSYLKVPLNGWNTFFTVPSQTVKEGKTEFTCEIKYEGVTNPDFSKIRTTVQLMPGAWSPQYKIEFNPSPAAFTSGKITIPAGTAISIVQLYSQSTVTWSEQTGDFVYLGKIKYVNEPESVKKVIARETFGNKAYDTNNPAPQPIGWGSGAAWHWNWMDITTLTSTNGIITAGSDSSLRINNYDNTLTKPDYWREPSGDMHSHMAIRDNDSYKGSWDTLVYSKIDISNAISVTAIEFGYARGRTLSTDTTHRSLNVEYRVNGGSWVQLDTSLIIPKKVYGKWDYIVLPVAITGKVLDIRFACLRANEQIYLDDITVQASVPVTVKKVIARETFGNKGYDTNNPTPQPSGWGSGGAWHWNWMDITTLTSTNGIITAGSDSSLRINNYDNTLTKPDYWREPSGDMHSHMAIRDNDTYKGSWDTLVYGGIDIASSCYNVSAIEFGYARARTLSTDTTHRSLNVEYRVDGGSWTQMDTSLIIPKNVYGKWDYIVMPVNITGKVLDIRFACLRANEQIYLDDITVEADAPKYELVKNVITRETFGSKVFDSNNPTPQATGWTNGTAWSYKIKDVASSLTSKNGNILAGFDSTIRINEYDPLLTKPAYWRDPSGSMHSHMAIRDNDAYKGSWDTLYFSNIDISKAFAITAIEFGYARARTLSTDTINHKSLNMKYRVDGGEWVQLDMSVINPKNVYSKWDYILMPVSIKGDKLDIMFACMQANEQIYLDDITVVGNVQAPNGFNDFAIEKVIFGTVDNPADFTGKLNMKWDENNAYLTFDITDDSIVNKGTNYQVDNIEVYFDIDNSKNIHWPRNGGWVANDPTYDANDYQLRLVPDVDFYVNNTKPKGVKQVYTKTDKGYKFALTIPWDSLMNSFTPAKGTRIGFDVLASDNDAVASDANRNQITMFSPSMMIYNDPSYMATFQFEDMGTFLPIPDTEKPGVVSNLIADITKNTVKLSWDNATDNVAILYYNIYQNTVLIKEKLYANKAGNSFTVKDLKDSFFTFGIETVDNFGNISKGQAIVPIQISTESVNDLSTSKLAVYPNPAISELNIKGVDNISKIEVIGITGNIMKVHNGSSSINVADLSKGAYFLKVYTAKEILTTRFLKN
jgi:hypothetical protein